MVGLRVTAILRAVDALVSVLRVMMGQTGLGA